jgi:hypothetical protein
VVVFGIGMPRGLGPKEGDVLDIHARAGLVVEGLKPDSSAGGGARACAILRLALS